MIATSINIDNDLLKIISSVAVNYNITQAEIIRKILRISISNLNYNYSVDCAARYQSVETSTVWKCFRINFSESDYDMFFACKHKFRISLSNLIFISFVLFFDDLINELKKENFITKYMYCYTSSLITSFHISKKYEIMFVKRKKAMEKT